ncbi:transketolase [Pseudactinotalea sp. HY160]|uniref:transketolase n=1 Tax=Pseudactinotalea sp. HY160 TaxID=2654490 RepID=UPI0013117D53|nr:transketolase [Pseudactinotalea sp. HY160]
MNVSAPKVASLNWSEVDVKAVAVAKALAADAVEKCGSGHPGAPISLAPAAYLLYQHVMTSDPADPHWLGRDRFVLSNGHACLLQYIQLYLGGFGLELDDIEHLRTWGSRTPGHPEVNHTPGIEVTTGPLGQGIAMAVGVAMAARRERGLLDPDAAPGTSPFDHHVYCVVGDGCLQEGVSSEASSLAGTQNLGNLITIWDDNRISIEGHTSIAFTEDVCARYEAYGWHVQEVDWTHGGTEYFEDVDALHAALVAAKAERDRPSFIRLKTIMAWPSPTKQDTGDAHGAKLGTEEVAGLKENLGLDPAGIFDVPADVIDHTRGLVERGAALRAQWDVSYEAWRQANPERAALLDRLRARELPGGWDAVLPHFPAGTAVATRAASGKVLAALAPELPELWGGSADLAGSNNTTMPDVPSFFPAERSSDTFDGNEYGRTLHFGIREFAMAAILNGISINGLTRAYGGTFLTFSDYMRPAVRLAALQEAGSIFVWTHDSIGLGEDGPTHQPIEHLAALRAIPQLSVVRPADANETAAAWAEVLRRPGHAAGLALTRQGVPTFPRGTDGFASVDGVARGAYVLIDSSTPTPDVILIGTGSEVQHAVAAREQLEAAGIGTRVVSAPCLEWFDAEDAEYRESVLPAAVRARVSIEAGVAMPWFKYLGTAGRAVSIEHFGASADAATLFREFGFTPEAVVAAAKESIAADAG